MVWADWHAASRNLLKLPQSILGATCEGLSSRWQIEPELATRLMRMDRFFRELAGVGLQIISGYRTAEEQNTLDRDGRPAAPDHLSTHRECPATGADLQPETAATLALKGKFGAAARYAGLRWGGGSPPDRDGLPSDWNHVDLGPRRS